MNESRSQVIKYTGMFMHTDTHTKRTNHVDAQHVNSMTIHGSVHKIFRFFLLLVGWHRAISVVGFFCFASFKFTFDSTYIYWWTAFNASSTKKKRGNYMFAYAYRMYRIHIYNLLHINSAVGRQFHQFFVVSANFFVLSFAGLWRFPFVKWQLHCAVYFLLLLLGYKTLKIISVALFPSHMCIIVTVA